jgi:hypothetical protein
MVQPTLNRLRIIQRTKEERQIQRLGIRWMQARQVNRLACQLPTRYGRCSLLNACIHDSSEHGGAFHLQR